jgi:hypothetical protein
MGAKFLVVLCAGSTLLLVQSKALDEAPYKLSGAIAKLAGITFRSWLFPTGSINLGFLLRENLLLCSSYLPLGVPNWVVISPHQYPKLFSDYSPGGYSHRERWSRTQRK